MSKLPLIEFAKTLYPAVSLSRVSVIAVQHLLETTHVMFRAWLELGLKPENLHVLGKCYSTNRAVAQGMRAEGINVSRLSTQFDSHLSYDEQFDWFAAQFWEEALDKCQRSEKIIVLDDGGHLLSAVKQSHQAFVGVEQTSSGLEKIGKVNFPVINVAKSAAKSAYEPPMVAEVIARRIKERLKLNNILIMGNGFLGQALKAVLPCAVTTYDRAEEGQKLEDLLPQADLIIGCTGEVSIPAGKHGLLKKGVVLVSCSSSDREFDCVHIRKKVPSYSACHSVVATEEVTLLNSGFPVNFTGAKNSVAPDQIQLIRGLLTAAVLQAAEHQGQTKGLVELDAQSQRALVMHYNQLWKKVYNHPI